MKGRGTSSLRKIDQWGHGVGRFMYPDGTVQRASHAVEIDGNMWLLDPVDAPGVDNLFAELGDVVGIMVGLDRHKRDSAALTNHHEVPAYATSWMTGVADEPDATVGRFRADLADFDFETFRLINHPVPLWQEIGFYHDGYGLLVVPESTSAVGYFCIRGEHLGVHPMLRPFLPQRVFSRYDLDRLLIGHDAGVPVDAGDRLRTVLGNARRNLLSAYTRTFTSIFSN